MEGKQDRRVRRTQEAIEKALISLVAENGYELVTVREIIDRADVGRSTFYAHYTGKQEVLDACLDRIEDFLGRPSDNSTRGVAGFNPGLFAGVAKHKELYQALLPTRTPSTLVQARVERHLVDALYDRVAALVPKGHTTPVPIGIVVHALVGTYLALLSGWLNNDVGAEYSPPQMEGIFHLIASSTIGPTLGLDE